jgi:FixJ family two-component response regulator
MPNLTGSELQGPLMEQGRHLPIIFITAFPNEVLSEQILRAGGFAFLDKPFDGGS